MYCCLQCSVQECSVAFSVVSKNVVFLLLPFNFFSVLGSARPKFVFKVLYSTEFSRDKIFMEWRFTELYRIIFVD